MVADMAHDHGVPAVRDVEPGVESERPALQPLAAPGNVMLPVKPEPQSWLTV
jgi:hypothetical protein